MKKITFFTLFLICQNFLAQSYTSGNVLLTSSNGINFSTIIETDEENVTLTLVGPSNRYLGIGFGVNAMTSGGDVVIFDGTNLTDRTFVGNNTPTLDAVQTWTILSNTINNNVRTLVARRVLNSGQPNNFVFNNNGQSIMLVWAVASTNTFSLEYHGSNRGATMSDFTLSQDEYSSIGFSMFPNPAKSNFTIQLPEALSSAQLTIYDLLGKVIDQRIITETNSTINVSSLVKGMYLVIISSDGVSETKKLFIH
jgi:hypothetical protein